MTAVVVILAIAALVTLIGPDEPAPPSLQERIVLLPGQGGQTGAVVVTTDVGATLLSEPYAAADVYRGGVLQARREDPSVVRERFAASLAALPPAPISFTVYFLTDTDELTPESLRLFDRVKAELAARPVPEIVVIGHTDRVGTPTYNDALSLKRADTVRVSLIAAGVPAEGISIAGRGEREPAVPTADEVPEPRNRRVEITVR